MHALCHHCFLATSPSRTKLLIVAIVGLAVVSACDARIDDPDEFFANSDELHGISAAIDRIRLDSELDLDMDTGARRRRRRRRRTPSTACAGHYGDAVGDAVCCDQAGTISSADRICGSSLPYCLGFVHGSQWGACQASAPDVRLTSYPRGRLEVKLGTSWHPACGHWLWNNNNGAHMACKRMGFPQGGKLHSVSGKKDGRSPWKLPKDAVYIGTCKKGEVPGACTGKLAGQGTRCCSYNCARNSVGCGDCKAGNLAGIEVECVGPRSGASGLDDLNKVSKGTLAAFPLSIPGQACRAGGLGGAFLGNREKEKECNNLSQTPAKCQTDPTCTFHGRCTVHVPLTDPKLTKVFPSLAGRSFTCSCDQDIQMTQVEQFWGAFLQSLGPKIKTCRAKPHVKRSLLKKYCKKQHRRRDCLASPWCRDAESNVAKREKIAKDFVDRLIKCADKKCAKCQAGSQGVGVMELEDSVLEKLNITGRSVDLELSDAFGGGTEC